MNLGSYFDKHMTMKKHVPEVSRAAMPVVCIVKVEQNDLKWARV